LKLHKIFTVPLPRRSFSYRGDHPFAALGAVFAMASCLADSGLCCSFPLMKSRIGPFLWSWHRGTRGFLPWTTSPPFSPIFFYSRSTVVRLLCRRFVEPVEEGGSSICVAGFGGVLWMRLSYLVVAEHRPCVAGAILEECPRYPIGAKTNVLDSHHRTRVP